MVAKMIGIPLLRLCKHELWRRSVVKPHLPSRTRKLFQTINITYNYIKSTWVTFVVRIDSLLCPFGWVHWMEGTVLMLCMYCTCSSVNEFENLAHCSEHAPFNKFTALLPNKTVWPNFINGWFKSCHSKSIFRQITYCNSAWIANSFVVVSLGERVC